MTSRTETILAISIHALLAESDWNHPARPTANNISIHALLAESDHCFSVSDRLKVTISIHALLAESDKTHIVNKIKDNRFLSTLSLRRATIPNQREIDQKRNFYPRSPCGERQTLQNWRKPHEQFLSTLSLRRATATVCKAFSAELYFYPRSPCGERLNCT